MSRYANKHDYAKCCDLYEIGGNQSVYTYAELTDLKWGAWCAQCETEVPPVKDGNKFFCLCCGQDVEKISQVEGSICENCGYDMGENYEHCGASEDGICPECHAEQTKGSFREKTAQNKPK